MIYKAKDKPKLNHPSNISSLFYNENLFDAYLGDWNISNIKSLSGIFSLTSISPQNYALTLKGWAKQEDIPKDRYFEAQVVAYCDDATQARSELKFLHGWNFNFDYHINGERCD